MKYPNYIRIKKKHTLKRIAIRIKQYGYYVMPPCGMLDFNTGITFYVFLNSSFSVTGFQKEHQHISVLLSQSCLSWTDNKS